MVLPTGWQNLSKLAPTFVRQSKSAYPWKENMLKIHPIFHWTVTMGVLGWSDLLGGKTASCPDFDTIYLLWSLLKNPSLKHHTDVEQQNQITAQYRKHFVSSQHLTAAYIHSKVPLLGDKCDKHLKTLYFERWPKKSLNPRVSPVHALQQKAPWSHSSRQKGLETWVQTWSRLLQQEMENSSSWSSCY